MASKSPAAATPPTAGGGRRRPGIRPVLAALVLATLLATLDTQIVATALPTIVGDLGGIDRFAWVSTAYLLTLTITTVLAGKLGDLLGRKPVFLAGIAIFLVGSGLCGLSLTMSQLIGFRAVQGVGAGAMTVSVFAIIGDLFEPRERARYQGLFAAVFAVSGLLGPLLGGVLTQQLGWRSIFYVNIPLGLLVLAAIAARLHLPPTRRRARLDIAGALTLGGAVTCLLLLTGRAATDGWTSPGSLALLAATVILAAGWVLAERRAPEPILPLGLFRASAFTGAAVIAFVGGAASLGLVSYLALFLQQATGATATNAGLLLLPGSVGIVAGNVLAGHVIARTGRYKAFLIASMGLGVAAVALLVTMTPQTGRLESSVYLLLYGLAAGLSQQVVVVAAQAVAPPADLGAATGAITFTRLAGSTIGIAVYGSVLTAQLAHQLAATVPPPALAMLHGGSLTPIQVRQLPPDVHYDVAQAYAHALTAAFAAAIPALAVGLLLAVLLRSAPIPQRPGQHAAQAAPGGMRDS